MEMDNISYETMLAAAAAEVEDNYECVVEVKEKACRRKGRGFNDSDSNLTGQFHSLQDGPGPQRSIEGWIIFISSIHPECDEEELLEHLSEFGNVRNLNLNVDRRTGFLKGYALVEYGLYKEALAAKEALDGSEILGQQVFADWCFVGEPRRRTRPTI